MNDPNTNYIRTDELVSLRRKYHTLMVMVSGLFILWLGTALINFAHPAYAEAKNPTPSPAAPAESLQVRELVVVDKNGTPRVRIGAPVPDPIMMGKRSKRGGDFSGIIIYDAEGNERGGYGTGDESRSALLTLDEVNRAAVHLAVNDRGEMHFFLSNGRGGFTGMGVNPSGGWLQINKPGQPSIILPNAPEGEKK